MLPKKQRLTAKDFPVRPVRRVAFAFGSVSFVPGPPRAAVVVSKKVASSAVDRNRIRRRFYALLRPLLSPHRGIVVYPNKKALNAPAAELKVALVKALSYCSRP